MKRGICRTTLTASLLATAVFASAAGAWAATPAPAPAKAGPMARLLARDSGQSVAAVLALKQQDGTWKAVVAALKLDPAAVGAQLAALRRGRRYVADVVAVLAKLSGKTATDVRGLKKPGVTWSQVASDLGVNWAAALPQIGARFRAQQTARLRAAVTVQTLAKLSGKTAADVRGLKKPGVTWSQVASDLGVNWAAALPQIGARFQARLTARLRATVTVQTLAKLSGKTPAEVRGLKKPGVKWTQVASELGVAWTKASPLIRQRVTALTDARIRTAAVVGLLAKLSGKTPAEVRGLKKPGVTWVDVAHSLGIQ